MPEIKQLGGFCAVSSIPANAPRFAQILGMHSPSLAEFVKLSARGNVIPVTRRLLADLETPLSAYRKLRGAGESFLFESIEGGEHLSRYSFVGSSPRAVIKQTSGAEPDASACCKSLR